MKTLFSGLFVMTLYMNMLVSQSVMIESYGLQDGMPHTEVYKLLQAKDKRIWIATEGGVTCFDGIDFENYSIEDGLVSNDIKFIKEGRDNDIWVSYHVRGLSRIRNGRISLPQGLKDFSKNVAISSMDFSDDGDLILFTSDGIYSWNELTLESILLEGQLPLGRASYSCGIAAKDSIILWADVYNGCYQYHLGRKEMKRIYPSEALGALGWTKDICQDETGKIWLATHTVQYIENDSIYPVEFSPSSKYQSLEFIGADTILVASEGAGFFALDLKNEKVLFLDIRKSLPTVFVYDAIQDHEGNIWLASYGEGLLKYRDKSFVFIDEANGLLKESIGDAIYFNGITYIGTYKGILRLQKGQILDTLYSNYQCTSLALSKDEESLLFCATPRILSMDKQNNIQQISSEYTMQIAQYNDYLVRHDGSSLKFESLKKDLLVEIGFHNIREFQLFGEYLVVRSLNEVRVYNSNLEEVQLKDPLDRFYEFRSMDILGEDTLVLKSSKFLHLLKLVDDEIVTETFDLQKIPSFYSVNSILAEYPNLWMGGNNSLYKFDFQKFLEIGEIQFEEYPINPKYSKSFLADDGLIFDDEGKILGYSLTGLWIFDESQYKVNNRPPLIALQRVKADSREISYSQSNTDSTYRFDYQENNLEFDLSATSFDVASFVEYKYRLQGMNDGMEWSEPSTQNMIYYPFLPDGTYAFEFTARNRFSDWNPSTIKYHFVIERPLWKKLEFWLSLTVLTALLAFLAYRYKNKRESNQQKVFTKRMFEVHEKERSRLAREIHDSLGQKMILISRNAKGQNNEMLERLSEDALEELREISRGLHPVSLSHFGLKASMEDMIEKVDVKSQILIDYEIQNIDDYLGSEESLHVFRIVQEALTNVIKHSQATEVSITLLSQLNFLNLKIVDNGIGFDFGLYKGNTLGLESIKQRCDFLNADFDIRSAIKEGTSILIKIPVPDLT